MSKQVVIAGAPDPNRSSLSDGAGRQIFYTYVIKASLQQFEWDFDDPNGNNRIQPSPDCGQHPFLTAHSYVHYSDGRHSGQTEPDKYHVSVKERYALTVERYYVDSFGSHHDGPDQFPQADAIASPQSHPQFIGQVIPIGVNPTVSPKS